MDVLSDVLQAVRLNGAIFFDVRAGEPMIATTPPMSLVGSSVMPGCEHVIPFHIMLRGSCWVEPLGGPGDPELLEEGDIVIYPHGHSHIFGTEPGQRAEADLTNYVRRDGLSGPFLLKINEESRATNRFVCGYLGCDATPFNPLLEALPCQLLSKRPPGANHLEVDLIYDAIEESEGGGPGSNTILARLSELLFIRVMRRYIEQLPENSGGWLAGLRDRQVSCALQAVHARPAHDWTLEELARHCGMSRAAFSGRFAEIVGDTPMHYLAKWRMQLAARMLEQPGVTMEDVAEAVGYKSDAAFNRAFKNIVGLPPGTWRRSRSEALAGPAEFQV